MNITNTNSASILGVQVDTASLSFPLSNLLLSGALYEFTMSRFIYLVGDVSLICNFIGTYGVDTIPETYSVLIVNSPDGLGPLVNGNIDLSLVPFVLSSFGTADYATIATKTVTDYDSPITFNLDSAAITRVMATAARSGSTFTSWNGYLVLWVIAHQNTYLTSATPSATLTVDSTIDYANRFTGLQGPWDARSRVDECPVCGLRGPRENWGYSGWHKRMVGMECIDPPDPYDIPLVIDTEDPLGGGEDM